MKFWNLDVRHIFYLKMRKQSRCVRLRHSVCPPLTRPKKKLTTGHKESLFTQLQKMCVFIFPSPKTLFYRLSSVSAMSCCTRGQGCHCLVFTASATIHILRLMSQICFPLFNLHQSTRCYLLFSMVVWTTLPPPPGRHWRPMSSRLSSKVTNCLPALYHRRLLPPFSKTIHEQAIFHLGIFYTSLKEVIKTIFFRSGWP